MYPEQLLILLYQNILRLFADRGEHTLAKLDALLFKF